MLIPSRSILAVARHSMWKGRINPCVVKHRYSVFHYSTNDTSKQNQENRPDRFVDRVVEKLNDGIRQYPGETIAVLLASDIGGIGAMYGALWLSGISSMLANEPF